MKLFSTQPSSSTRRDSRSDRKVGFTPARTFVFVTLVAFFAAGISYEAEARRFGGSFKFSSAKSYKAPKFRTPSRSVSRPASTSTRTSTTRQGSFGGSSRASGGAAASRAAQGTRFASTPTNNFKSSRQQRAFNNYKSQQQSRFTGTTSTTSASRTNYSSSPVYRNASRNSSNTRDSYFNRRDTFYGGWNAPGYVYGGAPRYGMFDGLFLGYMLGHAMTPSYARVAYHHQNDPGMKEWMADMEAQAETNAELAAELDTLKAEMARMAGTPIDPSYVPTGLDADLMLAPDVAATMAPTFRLCTASSDGNYSRFGEFVKEEAAGDVLVEVVHTAGSMENLKRLESGRCDGAYVQRNAFGVYADRNPSGSYKFERVATPAIEFAHMICNRDSGVEDVGDLPGRTLLVDQSGSGTEVTWSEFVTMDDNYSDVVTKNTGGSQALMDVSNGRAACMLFVASLNTRLLERANELGDTVRLVPVNDWDFNDKKYGNGKLFQGLQDPSGERVYEFHDIPDDQYDNIQDGILFSAVETLSVPVDMVASLAWSKENPEAYNSLLGAVLDSQSSINRLTRME